MRDSLSHYSEYCDGDPISMYVYSAKTRRRNALAYSFKRLVGLKIQKSPTDPSIVTRFSVNQPLSYYSECGGTLITYVKNNTQGFVIKQYNELDEAYHFMLLDRFITNNNCRHHEKLVRLKNVHRL